MNKDEALKMAIEFIDNVHEGEWLYVGFDREDVINACKEALEQPAQEPVAYRHLYSAGFEYCDVGDQCNECEPLYTYPHQWQGLTDDENEAIIQSIWEWGNDFPYDEYRICIQQALKEKNT